MQSIKDILEIIYYICSPVLAFFAFRALGQIREAKLQVSETIKSRVLSSKREAYKVAADKCEYYLTAIIPQINVLDKFIEEKDITFFDKSSVKINKDNIQVKAVFKDEAEAELVYVILPCLEVFNPLESFSLFFISGIADEGIGYLTVGTTFCNSVKKYLPLLVLLSDGKHFTNTLRLFRMWNSRLEKELLEKEKSRIEKKLNENPTITIKNIGTE